MQQYSYLHICSRMDQVHSYNSFVTGVSPDTYCIDNLHVIATTISFPKKYLTI